MTPLPALVDAAGRPVRLEAFLASGGEGNVFTVLTDAASVVKVYKSPPSQQTLDKLKAMVSLATPALSQISAWPSGLMFYAKTREPAGFAMPRMTDCQPIQHLYNPVQRLKSFPRAGWSFQVRAAINLAAAFDEVHKAGCLVGDVNQSNAFVSGQALIRLIDCDSFQVKTKAGQYLCEVGVPHYIPPELQGKPLRGLVRTQNHDRFGMAVLIYQLLFVGRHPYAGVYSGPGDPSFEEMIADYRFAQGPKASSWGMAPPPLIPTFADIPPGIGTLFRRSFEKGSPTDERPRPDEWIAGLRSLEAEIVECAADKGHFYWKGLKKCVWCRLAERNGPEYYFGVGGRGESFEVDAARLQEVQRRLAAVHGIEFPYVRAHFIPLGPKPVIVGRPLPEAVRSALARWKTAESEAAGRMQERQAAENEEKRVARQKHRSQLERLLTQYRKTEAELREREERDRKAVADERLGQRLVSASLVGATLLGGLTILLGSGESVFFVAGAAMVAVFGIWLAAHLSLAPFSPARRRLTETRKERAQARISHDDRTIAAGHDHDRAIRAIESVTLERRQRQEAGIREAEGVYRGMLLAEQLDRNRKLKDAEALLLADEAVWSSHVSLYKARCQTAIAGITVRVASCRGLEAGYRKEADRLLANAKAVSRVRHLRLHSIAAADIPGVRAGRKQALADAKILSADDVDEGRIRGIKGFGDVLTANLLAWKEEVLRNFRFDPKTDISPSEQSALTSRFRTRQNQLLGELDADLTALEALAPVCRSALEALGPTLRVSVARFEQAAADLAVAETRG